MKRCYFGFIFLMPVVPVFAQQHTAAHFTIFIDSTWRMPPKKMPVRSIFFDPNRQTPYLAPQMNSSIAYFKIKNTSPPPKISKGDKITALVAQMIQDEIDKKLYLQHR